MPASLIQDEDRVGAGGDLCGDFIEMKLHGFGVAERENEGSAIWESQRESATQRVGIRRH